MSAYRHYPNRKKVQASTGSTDWEILGLNGTFYASHAAALSAGTVAWPGRTDFPTGMPRVIIQMLASSGAAAGSEAQVATNTLITPTTPDADVPAGDPLVLDDADVTSLWVKQSVAGDLASVTGMF